MFDLLVLHKSVTHLTDPDTIILFMGAESSMKVNPTKALSNDPKYASRTSGDTGGGEERGEERQVVLRETR